MHGEKTRKAESFRGMIVYLGNPLILDFSSPRNFGSTRAAKSFTTQWPKEKKGQKKKRGEKERNVTSGGEKKKEDERRRNTVRKRKYFLDLSR